MENKKSEVKKGLTKEEVARIAAEAGTKAGIEAFQRAQLQYRKETNDRRLHNTKMLLRSYRKLKLHCEKSVYQCADAMQPTEYGYQDQREVLQTLWDCFEGGYDDLYIESILRSKTRTATMVAHIESMLELYEENCKRNGRKEDLRRFRVVKSLYIDDDDATVQYVASINNIDTRTVYKWIDYICGDLSALIFGLGGIRM